MNKSKWFAVMCIVALVGVAGCSDDDDDPLTPDVSGEATAAAIELAMENALDDVVDPLFDIIEFVQDNFLSAPVAASRGVACPDLTGVCGEPPSGSVTCTPTLEGLQFDFVGCNAVLDGTSIIIDGTATLAGTLASAILGLQGLSLDGGVAITGTVTFSSDECESADISITAADNTGVLGIVVVCFEYPESTSSMVLNVTVLEEVYTITFIFDGTGTAIAIATDNSGATIADCEVNLDSLAATCSAP
jgi:hypothetical protein